MSSIDTKELKESLGFGLAYATFKAALDYVLYTVENQPSHHLVKMELYLLA